MRFLLLFALATFVSAADRPNILWLTWEDSSPHLGCYGDPIAVTPNFDALAKKGMRYKCAWSNAPVCAPARTCIISGRWAPANGAEHMRSEVPMPAGQKMFPQFLREAGYYCTNNAKEDYNLTKPDGVWDESSKNAHWKNRKDGQPFFAVFNHEKSHESQIRAKPHTLVHDPAQVKVPRYMPDTPEVRHDWAQHFDNVTTVDQQIAAKIKEVQDAGLGDDTIIFTFADHGTGMPRSKRWPYDSGLRVPFIVYFPEKWKHLAPKEYDVGGASERLISFIDLAPTMLSIAGIEAPDYFHGRAFAGSLQKDARKYAFGFRGRMDERIDMARSVTDGRYVYIRHFMPHLPEGQHVNYMFEQASTRVWYDLWTKNNLKNEYQEMFWRPKETEELYDLQKDPWETDNLVTDQSTSAVRRFMQVAMAQWMIETRDLGLVPEAERLAVSAGRSPADAFADEQVLPYRQTLKAALEATDRSFVEGDTSEPLLTNENPEIRYWGVTGLLMRGERCVPQALPKLAPLLDDKSPSVRVAAAEALAKFGSQDQQAKAWDVLLKSATPATGSAIEATEALNALDRLGDKAKPNKDKIAGLNLTPNESSPARTREYPKRLVEYLGTTLGFDVPKEKGEGKAKGKGRKKK